MQGVITNPAFRLAVLIIGFAWGQPSRADSWLFPATLTEKAFAFGKTKVVLEVDGREDQSFPPHAVSIYVDGALRAKYRGVGFEQVHPSADKKYFVGLSNGGIPGTAFVVFDAAGNLIREQKHDFMPDAVYTSRSVTVIREWFDDERPGVEFNAANGRLVGVIVRGSNGKRYDLLKADLGAGK